MLREIIQEGFIDKVLDKIMSFGVKNSRYIAKLYSDKESNYGGKLPTKITSAHTFYDSTLATGYMTGVFSVKNKINFIGISKSVINSGDTVQLHGPLKKFDNMTEEVYIIKKKK